METSPTDSEPHLAEAFKRLAHRVFGICENRLELLTVEARQERDRIATMVSLTIGAAIFGLLAGFTLILIIMVLFWASHPVIALIVTCGIFAICGLALFVRVARLYRDWRTLPDTLEQLKKDRACLQKIL